MHESPLPSRTTRNLERFLAALGIVAGLIISVSLWLGIRAQQSMWPLPDLYLLEILAASSLGLWAIWSDLSGPGSLRSILAWTGIGIILGFVVLGAFSIGFAYIPVLGLLASAAILSDRRLGRNLLLHLGVGLAAALAQAGLMLAVIQILYR